MKDEVKTLATFFIVVIAIIIFLWYRSENAGSKKIEELNDQLSMYEERIAELEKENSSLSEVVYYYENER